MGSVIEAAGARAVRVSVRGSDAIDRIELLRGDRVLATHCHQGTWRPPPAGQAGPLQAAGRGRLGPDTGRDGPAAAPLGGPADARRRPLRRLRAVLGQPGPAGAGTARRGGGVRDALGRPDRGPPLAERGGLRVRGRAGDAAAPAPERSGGDRAGGRLHGRQPRDVVPATSASACSRSEPACGQARPSATTSTTIWPTRRSSTAPCPRRPTPPPGVRRRRAPARRDPLPSARRAAERPARVVEPGVDEAIGRKALFVVRLTATAFERAGVVRCLSRTTNNEQRTTPSAVPPV